MIAPAGGASARGGIEMGGWSGRKQAAVGAFTVVVLWVVGFFLAGKPPKFDDSSQKVVDYYANHHKQVLIAVILVAMGIAIFLAVAAQLSLLLRGAGERSLAAVVIAGAAAMAGLFSVGDALYGIIAQAVVMPGADPNLARALYELDQFAGIPIYWLSLTLILSVLMAARRGVFPSWVIWITSLLAVLAVLGGLSVKADGVFAAGTGLFANLGFAAALVFLLEVGLLLWSAKEPEAA
jgi:hypothetical protein